MIKLSQRAWNNVIIVSMLILISLFNFSSHFLNDSAESKKGAHALVPEDLTITTIEFEHKKIERIGQGWRVKSGGFDNDTLTTLVEHWLKGEIILFDENLSWQTNSSSVKLWFAGQKLPIEYRFFEFSDKTLVKIDQHTYQLINPDFHMLKLPE